MTRRLRVTDLAKIAVPEQPALSPDGSRIAYVLRTQDVEADQPVTSLWQVRTDGSGPAPLTQGLADSTPVWSPDGSRLAFLRAADGPAQVWLLPANGGEATQLTDLPLGAGEPAWSPDGSHIAFAAPVDTAPAADGSDTSNTPIVTDRLDYQADGAGYLRAMRSHLHVVDVSDKSCRQVTEGNWHAAEPNWSPDGSHLAFVAGMAGDADLNFVIPVHQVDVNGSWSRPELIGFADGVAGLATWTGDGRELLVIGSGTGPTGQAGLFRLPATGAQSVPATELIDLAGPLDRNVMAGGPAYPGAAPQLIADGREVLFCVRDRGCTHLYRTGIDSGEPQLVLGGDDQVVSGASAAGDTVAVVLSTGTSLGEIVTVDLRTGEQTVRTEHGAQLADVEWFARESRDFTISDGTVVQGWLMRDPASSGPRPLLLDVHGGPHNAWNGAADDVHLYHQELVARGWAVLLVNPRASDGYGADFLTATIGAWGTGDAADFLEPLDALVAEGVADREHLAVSGYSYGGFMTCYLTSRDQRFAAAVAGGVCADLNSLAGTSDAGHLLAAYELDAPTRQPSAQLDAMSPFSKVTEVTTPTLVVQGAADVRCPTGQAQQWFSALREQGVPTRLALYPGGSHLFIVNGRPSHRLDFNQRIIDWLEQYGGTGSKRPRLDQAHWQRRVAELSRRHKVPGAQLGILRLGEADDELVEAATGVLNVDTGAEVRPESLFQIGSITKVWTATVAMQLVDEGKLSLDAPVQEILPELELADPDVTKKVTLRHLLTHTSGIDGDVFTDTGRGDDCLQKYVALLSGEAQNHPLGLTWSYCNAGFSMIGLLIERVTDKTWDAAIRERLFTPLGLQRTVTLPEEVLLYGAAVGHVGEGDEPPKVAPVSFLPRSMGPAGLVTSTVGDVLAFARMHLTGGLAPDGTQVLRPETVALMQEQHAELPDKHSLGDSWGLGWIRFGWSGHRLFGHDGNTIGQSAFLRVLPEQNLAVALLTNGGNTRDLYEDLYREIFAEMAEVEMQHSLEPPAQPVEVDIAPWLGTYRRESMTVEVSADDEGPRLRVTVTGPVAATMDDPTEEAALIPVAENLFVMRLPGVETWSPVTFYRPDGERRYIHFGARATPKVS
ncbi:serine hydrolase [Flexivirga endophytica]|uniref:Serine hydrolase n=1 Tax=Flexivirga endophytica TaxID=1849103 RepID=A0A916T331_9MICO|nr:serine hydrolase [Flexivirga endophytica]GGB28984.1 serine hydrolase [Flexivirga endophytica]GHB50031.1 serine hydrolase [Flexivirga endophytica]